MKRLHFRAAAFLFGSICLAQDSVPSPGWVVISLNDYAALRGKAYPLSRETEPPSPDATLTRVDYDLRIDGALATGRASVTVDVLKDGWVRVPLPPGLLVREARLGGQQVSLVRVGSGDGQLSAVLTKKGRSVLDLDVAFTLGSASGEERLALPTGPSGVTRASVALARHNVTNQDLEVQVTGGFVAEKSAAHWLVYARGNEPLVFTWRRKIEDRHVDLPLRMRGSLTQLFGLGEDSTSLNAEVEVEVVQGVAKQVKIAVPDSVVINQVPGATVADWDVKAGVLVVNFLEPVERSVKFAIAGEARLARDGSIAVPLLHLLEAERDTGGVAVEVIGAGEIKETKLQGLEAVDAADLGQMVAGRQSPSLAAYRWSVGAQAQALNLEVARYAQQAVLTANIEEARYRVLLTADGKTLVEARYAVRNNQRNFVRITLPTGAAVWSSSLGGRPVRPGQGPEGSLLFPLSKSRAGEDAPLFRIEIVYLAHGGEWSLKGRDTLALPALDLPVSRAGLLLYYPPLFRLTPQGGAFHAQPYERPESDVWTAPTTPQVEVADVQNTNAATQALVDRYRARTNARKTTEPLPTSVAFPAVGPKLYLVSELTGESKAPVIELDYQKDKKGGVK
ncbi:MAG TPA: hypothetical protein VG096_07480 [Bryobacteraceae bacterium]|jgi:hypothetical protein|nr:hypothetical protein [Bryobacteraceae bacterium]